MILDDILLKKHEQLARNSYLFDIVKIIESFKYKKTESFFDAMAKDGLSIIGEIKKASPKGGLFFKEGFDPVKIALKYDWAVDAIAIITEEVYFLGSPAYIRQVREITTTPLIRKDFIISPIQIFQAKELGASAITLSASILDRIELQEYIKVSHGIHLDAPVEVRNEREIDMAVNSGAKIICICNYDLEDYKCDTSITLKLSKYVPKDLILISDGGVFTKEDLRALRDAHVNGVYVGGDFMRDDDILGSCREMRTVYKKI